MNRLDKRNGQLRVQLSGYNWLSKVPEQFIYRDEVITSYNRPSPGDKQEHNTVITLKCELDCGRLKGGYFHIYSLITGNPVSIGALWFDLEWEVNRNEPGEESPATNQFIWRKQIYLGDFQIERTHRGCGYGTLLLAEFIRYAKILQADEISGAMQPVDKHNWDRAEYLYKKFGFTVIPGEYSKSIRLDLREHLQ